MRFRRIGACILAAWAITACAQLPHRPDLRPEFTAPPGTTTQLDAWIAPAEAIEPQQSAFRLVTDGPEAFVLRERSATHAGRSLDIQTYIWHADVTGLYLAQRVLDAADRGVKVRLLIDDLDARARNEGLAALAAHPNIRVRLFNPLASRGGFFGYVGDWITSFDRINRRMHNKSWIADNRIAFVGGRNVGDEYFGASDGMNFVDLDFAMIGPVVRDVSKAFDSYWNAPSAYPMELLAPKLVNAAALEKLRPKLAAKAGEALDGRYAALLGGEDGIRRLIAGDWPQEWSSRYRFVADDPLKVTAKAVDPQTAQVAATLEPLIADMRVEVDIISPYFVPGEATTATLVAQATSGKQVRILTNSLSANDVAAVHGGYSRYREPLLAGGVQLWEMKPLSDAQDSSLFGSSGASLHTKALVVDSSVVFVGSFNVDPRSVWLNTEQGVLVRSPTLASQIKRIFASSTDLGHAWQVTLHDGDLAWSDGAESFDSDPKASAGRRFQAWLTRVLHLDAHL